MAYMGSGCSDEDDGLDRLFEITKRVCIRDAKALLVKLSVAELRILYTHYTGFKPFGRGERWPSKSDMIDEIAPMYSEQEFGF